MRTSVLIFLVGLFTLTQLQAQVKIGDNPQNINPAAVLELESTTMALIITRVTTAQMEAIVPSQGALVYNTDSACVHYYNGTEWVNLCSGANVNISAEPIVNQLEHNSDISTIVLTQTDEGTNIEVATESITGNQILDGSIFGSDFNDNSITGIKLANNAVTAAKLSENAVGPFAINRDSLPLSFFNNDVPFLIAGDITTVSDDAGNAISSGSDGGAFFDASPLFDAVANDLDGDPENELQALSRTGNDLILTSLNGTDYTIPLGDLAGTESGLVSQFAVVGQNLILTEDTNDFPVPLAALAAAGSTTDELQDLAFDAATNILTVTTPATAGNQVDLSSLAGGNTGSTEFIDGTTLTGLGTAIDPFKIEPSLTNGQFLSTDATGAVVWDDLPGGTGGAVNSDGTTITGDGVTTDLSVLDGGITPIKIEPSVNNGDFLTTDDTGTVTWTAIAPGGTTEEADLITITGVGTTIDPFKIEPSLTNGQYLRTDSTGNVIWDDLPGGTGGAVTSDGITITGDGVATDLSVLDGGITPIKIEPSANINEVLTTDATGVVVWAVGGATGTTELADQATITGDGQAGTEFQVADAGITAVQLAVDAVTTVNILDDNVTPEKIEPGADGEVLTTNATGDVIWSPSAAPQFADQTTIIGDGLVGTEFQVADAGITAVQLAADAVTTVNILDDNVTPEKLEPGADGEFLTTNAAGNVIWSPSAAPQLADQATIIGDGLVGTEFQVADASITAVQLAADAVTTVNILNNNVTPEKLVPGAEGEVLTTNAAGAVIWSPSITPQLVDQVTIIGDGLVGTEFQVADAGITAVQLALDAVVTVNILDDNVTPEKLEPGADGEVLTTNATGDVIWSPSAAAQLADQATIIGDGQVGTEFQVADAGINTLQLTNNAVTTLKILDENVTPAKIAAGGNGQVLTTNGAGDVVWAAGGGTGTTEFADQATITGDGQAGTEFQVADAGINTLQLTNNAVTTLKILDENVTPAKIAAGGNGQVLTTNGTGDVVWAAGGGTGTGTISSTNLTITGGVNAAFNNVTVDIPAGAIVGGLGGLIADNTITASDLQADSVDASEIRIDAVGDSEIRDDAVKTNEILNLTILNEDISPAAAIEGSKIVPNFTAQITTTGGLSVQNDILLNGNNVIADYVFQKYFVGSSVLNENYNFYSLAEIDEFVKKNHHLPGIKSSVQVKKDGYWNLSESNMMNLEKIEELFLHTIDQEKEINKLKTKNDLLSKEMDSLREDLEQIRSMLKEQ